MRGMKNCEDEMAKSGIVFVKAINILKFYSNGIPFCDFLSLARENPGLLLFSPLSDKADDDDERKFISPTLHRKLISCKHTLHWSEWRGGWSFHFNWRCVTINSEGYL